MKGQVENIFRSMLPHFELLEGHDSYSIKQVRLWGKKYSLTKWDESKYEEKLREIIRLYPSNSPSLVEGWFSNAFAKILVSDDQKNSIKTESEEFVDFLARSTKKRSVCIPIQGIDLRVEKIEFGFGTLYRNDKGYLPELIADRDSLYSYQHGINALENCKCYFQVDLNTDHENSIDCAKKFSLYLCSLLNLYVGSTQYRTDYYFYPWHKRDKRTEVGRNRKIEVFGSESGDCQVYYEFYKNEDSYRKSEFSIEFNLLSPGHNASESINECIEFIRPDEAKTTYHLVNENTRNLILHEKNKSLLSCVQQKGEINKRLHQAVSWFGKAVNADIPEDQFLFFAISIESLLVGDEPSGGFSSQGSINQKISERSAFLLGNSFKERIEIEREIKRIYGIRSKIVHTGAKADNSDVIKIENINKDLIFSFSRRSFTSQQEFLRWFKERQYGE
ncbi:HEPN domain-containing protein [Aeromonas dhakensis]|uniref:HEPN domain-containing protein n=1 Tax=Aeromonas dhakensis TaxID=196024 RepID=UPI001FCBDDA2|nr:HEPN domain-containing protein [Aeromonas dhakensis]MCJ2367864.1 HEPN domain-containing protein [Aeromonas dhakensis]